MGIRDKRREHLRAEKKHFTRQIDTADFWIGKMERELTALKERRDHFRKERARIEALLEELIATEPMAEAA